MEIRFKKLAIWIKELLFGKLEIQVKKLVPEAKLPTRKYPLDAGMDVYTIADESIGPGNQVVVRTGIALAGAPNNCVIHVWPKGGLDAQYGIHTGAGVIEPNYRGEILILLRNFGKDWIALQKGEACAQLVITELLRPTIKEVATVQSSSRGAHGGITDLEETNAI